MVKRNECPVWEASPFSRGVSSFLALTHVNPKCEVTPDWFNLRHFGAFAGDPPYRCLAELRLVLVSVPWLGRTLLCSLIPVLCDHALVTISDMRALADTLRILAAEYSFLHT